MIRVSISNDWVSVERGAPRSNLYRRITSFAGFDALAATDNELQTIASTNIVVIRCVLMVLYLQINCGSLIANRHLLRTEHVIVAVL
jgi:hypothetical protein